MSVKTFHTYASDTARHLAEAAPSARSDPFFAKRAYSHFMNGVENPGDKAIMAVIQGHANRVAAATAEEEAWRRANGEGAEVAASPVKAGRQRKRRKATPRAPTVLPAASPVRVRSK